MNGYDYDKIMGGYCDDMYYDGPTSTPRNPNYYHHHVTFNIVRETEKAFLLEDKKGEFWCPKSLLRNVVIKHDKLTGLLWDGFKPEFKKPEKPVDVFDAFAGIDKQEAKDEKKRKKIQKKLDKRLRKEKRKKITMVSTPAEVGDWFLDWLGVGK